MQSPTDQRGPFGAADSGPNDVVTIDEACAIIGGNGRPISRATFYRGAAKGIYPRPFKIGANLSRVLRSECLAVVRARIAERRVSSEAA